jgi:hypothetical protein
MDKLRDSSTEPKVTFDDLCDEYLLQDLLPKKVGKQILSVVPVANKRKIIRVLTAADKLIEGKLSGMGPCGKPYQCAIGELLRRDWRGRQTSPRTRHTDLTVQAEASSSALRSP